MQKNKFKGNKLFAYLGVFCFLYCLLVCFFITKSNVTAQTSSDAIAIRVMQNPDHYSAAHWYREQNFSGSPQSIIVDGYNAVRDGRTIYANVANVSGGSLYTNIYLISYNQQAEKDTIDIFGRILDRWKFNTNVPSLGHCRANVSLFCLIDDDCPINDNCDSPKARITRDTRRQEDLAEITIMLNNYFVINSTYPNLNAGTYLPQNSLSVWPSWQETLSTEVGRSLPVDPVNKIGGCPASYAPQTCWDETAKSFSNTLPDIPVNSLLYVYTGVSTGASRSLCAVFESGLILTGTRYSSSTCPNICLDFDDDGYGDPGNASCSSGSALTDCNDNDNTVTVGTPENCSNGLDDDCDGYIDCNDGDCFGSPACIAVPPSCPDTFCDVFGGECTTCASDCSFVDCCGNTVCEAIYGENSENCSDCSANCDGNICDIGAGECNDCPSDCDFTDCCGLASPSCDIAIGENNFNCPSDCTCTDVDGDRYIDEASISGCGAVCGIGTEICLGPNDCDDNDSDNYPTNSEDCDGVDNNCDSNIDEGFTEETCNWMCSSAGFQWLGVGCCGNDPPDEGNPLLFTYEVIESTCDDGIDNDCDGTCDGTPGQCYGGTSAGDSDCPGVDCTDLSEDNHVGGSGTCDQCANDGDQDGDQSPSVGSLDWTANYPNWADRCDTDCFPGVATLHPASPSVHIDDFELNTELTCVGGVDEDCDGDIDCDDSDCVGTPACCIDDCVALSVGCVDANNRWYCGEAGDGDTCLEPVNVSCGIDTCVAGVCLSACTDVDGDGFNVEGGVCGPIDCNDDGVGDTFMYPGNPETCDNLDNDCSGDVDDGCDSDGDGYCDYTMDIWYNNTQGAGITICPSTLVNSLALVLTPTNDCNDGDGAIHPGATETCDGADNDCNAGTADGSEDPIQYHPGHPNGICQDVVGTCTAGAWVFTNPVGYESPIELTCDDNLDNNCNGLTDNLAEPAGPDPDCPTCCDFDFNFPCEFCL